MLAVRDAADDLEEDSEKGRSSRDIERIISPENTKEKIIKLKKIDADQSQYIETLDPIYEGEMEFELKRKRYEISQRIEELETQLKEYKKYTPRVILKRQYDRTDNYEFYFFTNDPFHYAEINHYVMKNLKRRLNEFRIETSPQLHVSEEKSYYESIIHSVVEKIHILERRRENIEERIEYFEDEKRKMDKEERRERRIRDLEEKKRKAIREIEKLRFLREKLHSLKEEIELLNPQQM